MGPTKPGQLFDLALLLDVNGRERLCRLVDRGDKEMGRELRGLLRRFKSFEELLNDRDALPDMLKELPSVGPESATVDAVDPFPQPEAGEFRQLGPYQIERAIESGGQGDVYLARQETTDRQVALKLIRGGIGLRPDDRARFKRELKILAMMEHDHIAAIYEADTSPEGIPFFSMEYVKGSTITDYCRAHRLPIDEKIKLFTQVCDGVAHAHQRLVLHRDLKPANILVKETDGRPQVKIIDFGIARGMDSNSETAEQLTAAGPVGTPGYMAPEMFKNADPDTRWDIYALGVLLYQLIADRPPLTPPDHLEWDEKWRYFREKEPPPPGSHLSGKPSKIRDLDAIVLKAMARDPERRYESVVNLKRDCESFLEGHPVEARVPSFPYLLGRFVARNKKLVSASVALLLSLIAGLLATGAAERKAQKERHRFEKSFGVLEQILATPDPHRMGAQARIVDVLQAREATFDEVFGQDEQLESMIRAVWGRTYHGLGFYKRAGEHLERTVFLMTRNRGAKHPQTLRAGYLAALAMIGQGRYDDAEISLRHIYSAYPNSGFDNEKLDVLASISDVYQSKNQSQKATPLLDAMARHVFASSRSETRARYLFSLANIHHNLGNPEAEDLYRQSLEILNVTETRDPQTLKIMSGLANHLRRKERFDEAESLYRRVMTRRALLHGESHYLVQYSRAGLAMCLMDQMRYQEAETLISGVAESMTRLRASHPETNAMMRRLATVLRYRGKYQQAEELLRNLARHYRDHDLHRTVDALKVRSNLADVLILSGEEGEAVHVLTEAIQDMTDVLGKDHLTTTTAMMTLGQAHQQAGNRLRAENVYSQALELLATSRPNAREMPYYRAIRANNLTGLGRFSEAEPVLLQSLSAVSQNGAMNKEIRTFLVTLYKAQGKEEQAAGYVNPPMPEKEN